MNLIKHVPIVPLQMAVYSLLTNECASALESVGLDAYVGFLHQDRPGRKSLALDLMEELRKIVRVMKKIDESAPDEVMLVLDATTGQNAVSQVRLFSEAVKVTGITITKLDGSAKGGVVYALCDEFKIPLRFVGIGEKAEDLRPFDARAFTDAVIG